MTPAGAKILTVTCNPALDITYDIDRLTPYEVHRVHRVTTRAGGKGVNVASVARQLGTDTSVTGFIGGHTGHMLQDLLDPRITQAWVEVAEETRRTTTLVDDRAGLLLNEPGAPLAQAAWDSLASTVESLSATHAVVAISGSLPQNATGEQFSQVIAAARAGGATVIVDTSGPLLLAAAAAGASILKPNRAELLEATGTTTIDEGVRALQSIGDVSVLLSDGERGLGVFPAPRGRASARRPLWARPGEVIVGNATGAGDAVVASLAHDLAGGAEDWTSMLASAVARSGAAVAAPVAGLIDDPTYERLLPLVTLSS
ncbi:MAG: hexose kinase [Dermabacter sp.]|nr:hexose kinase [Dermabacter sp.]